MQKFQRLIETADVLIVGLDAQGRITLFNRRCQEVTGYSEDEVGGRKIWDFLLPERYIEPVKEVFRSLLEDRLPSRFENPWLTKDGAERYISWSNTNIKDEEGNVIEIFGIGIDITEHREVEKEAKRLNQYLESIIDNANVWLDVLDREGNVVIWNKAAEKISGYSRDEVVGHNKVWEWLYPHEGYRTEIFAKAAAIIERGEVVEDFETTICCKDGQERIISWNSRNLVDEQGKPVGSIALGRDITERKRAERLKSEFISTVSHELRTPLTSIKGYGDLLLAGDAGELNETQREFIGVIVRNADRLTKLINDLLDIEKIESGTRRLEFRECDLSEILRDVAETFQVNAQEKGLSFVSELEEGLKIEGDADYLAQAFANLLSNAVKYTKEGSVQLRAWSEGNGAIVQVKDSGIGMSKEELSRLFRRFFRADNSYVKEVEGTGLGLSIVKATIDRHGGEIAVESEPHKGSTFKVTLPLRKAWTDPERAVGAGGPTVLIIEDDEDIARLIQRYIEGMGYRAVIALSGREGIEQAREFEPDLITLDILMPEMDGLEVIQRLKEEERTSSIPVVFISIVQDRERGLKLGASAYLTKPIDERRLKRVVAELIVAKIEPILVVDDDPDFCRLMERLLGREGFRVESAHDGEEALKMIRSKGYQLILLDKNLPRKSGIEVLIQLRADGISSAVPVIMISGSPGAEEIQEEFKVLGAREFLSKRLDPQEVVREIVNFLKEGEHDGEYPKERYGHKEDPAGRG